MANLTQAFLKQMYQIIYDKSITSVLKSDILKKAKRQNPHVRRVTSCITLVNKNAYYNHTELGLFTHYYQAVKLSVSNKQENYCKAISNPKHNCLCQCTIKPSLSMRGTNQGKRWLE